MSVSTVEHVEIHGDVDDDLAWVLSDEALAFIAGLHRAFNGRRVELLEARIDRQRAFDAGELPDFLPETADVRAGDWKIAPEPAQLADRRVEITGPVDRKMVINALNSGAKIFMADFEDANSPTWSNALHGQRNLHDAIRRTIEFDAADGKQYRLRPEDELATLLVRPRGWHLVERHLTVDGEPVSGGLFDLGLYLFHNAAELLERGAVPAFYLPKLESHLEARLWNDVFVHVQHKLDIPVGTIKATVLIETILAAFEMDEILYELRDHSAGLNAGRWDYIFSAIKKFRNRPEFMLPDRSAVTMAVPFMRAYTELLVKTCHRRGAHAMGGMAAFIPNRRDPIANDLAIGKVREDKQREAAAGFDGTWVAHPDLVATAQAEFDAVLGERPNQLDRQRDDVEGVAAELLDLAATPGQITEQGLRSNITVGIQYLSSWLRGNGAVAINSLMEDAATAEISRSQVWQWIRHGATLAGGPGAGTVITRELVAGLIDEELGKLQLQMGPSAWPATRGDEAGELFRRLALEEEFIEFLTLPAYDALA